MNMQIEVPNLRTAHPAPASARGVGETSRFSILDQVVAGIMWMSLDLPEDVSRGELEALAHDLVVRIGAGAALPAIEAELTLLYSGRFCSCADAAAIRNVARRATIIVKECRG